jgi:hypothetical protein
MKGPSPSNLKDQRSFAQEYPDRRIGQQSADQWLGFHIVTLAIKLSDADIRDGYAREALDLIGQRSAAQLPWFPIDTSLPSIEEIEAELSRDLGPEDQP